MKISEKKLKKMVDSGYSAETLSGVFSCSRQAIYKKLNSMKLKIDSDRKERIYSNKKNICEFHGLCSDFLSFFYLL